MRSDALEVTAGADEGSGLTPDNTLLSRPKIEFRHGQLATDVDALGLPAHMLICANTCTETPVRSQADGIAEGRIFQRPSARQLVSAPPRERLRSCVGCPGPCPRPSGAVADDIDAEDRGEALRLGLSNSGEP